MPALSRPRKRILAFCVGAVEGSGRGEEVTSDECAEADLVDEACCEGSETARSVGGTRWDRGGRGRGGEREKVRRTKAGEDVEHVVPDRAEEAAVDVDEEERVSGRDETRGGR